MQPLEKSLRNKLEKTVKDARDIAEDSARAALEQLGVGEPTAYPHLTETDRKLRRKLRAHGRQLGNGRNAKGKQALDRLIEEVAYEHWHRMLFARFLAENNLLMYPDPDDPVAVTLEECEDLAADEGASNGWELASRYAARMLPQIFRPDSPVFQLTLPPEHQQKLERLIADLSNEVFTASDSLGWVYQFWQAKKKDKINSSEVKIGARELPAVTQLFTEPYMVSFLLDNSLGAWWAARRLTEADLKNAKTEDELRRKASLPGVALEYLRFVKGKDGKWIPAAGTFAGWPEKLAELKMLDPCCGSGHFFVAAFLMLIPMRMEREELSARQAVDRVLSENIHGLELDQRCVELAALAIALAAWTYPDAGGYRPLPKLNLACTGLSVGGSRIEWEKLANGNSKLRVALFGLYEEFKNAPILGSLIDPTRGRVAKLIGWNDLAGALAKALGKERTDEQREAGIAAHGLAEAARLLAGKYHWVITNVPYLARGKQDERLRDFCEKNYPAAKNDLATVFLDRCLELCVEGGTSCIVLPQNWLFLTSYRKFREKLLKNDTWHLIARLGPSAFETISGEVVKAILITLSRGNVEEASGLFKQSGSGSDFQSLDKKRQDAASTFMRGLDVSEPRTAAEKAAGLLTAEIKSMEQAKQLENQDSVVSLEVSELGSRLGKYARSLAGLDNGDTLQFRFVFWETLSHQNGWVYQVNATRKTFLFDGREHILRWENGKGNLVNCPGARLSNIELWGSNGVYVSRMNNLPSTLCLGTAWDRNGAMIVPREDKFFDAIWAYCSSEGFSSEVRKLNQKLSVSEATFENIPFDLDYWTKVAAEKYPNGLPKPYSDDPTQWIFHGHPCGSVVWDEEKKRLEVASTLRTNATVLQATVARLLGYRWPAETNPEMELADESREWVKRSQELLPFADEDGIVCIPPVRGEMKAEDRLENLLAAAYGNEWSSNKKAELLAQAGHTGKTLKTWLRDKFFTQHCKLFQHRPFIWHIWDGLRDGFAALVNYHMFDAKLLETLIYTYLGDWISRQKQGIGNGVDSAQEKLDAAEALKKKLELVIEGEAPYDIFVRWESIEKQPIGWNPDLNDGVRLNIRPFMTVPDVGKKGAGILRDKPNIKWTKDRGKDVASAPWYQLFKGDRINDHHLNLAEKKAAREAVRHE
ncbi:MAG: BREX-1 system adenine-specific DNA-methyltransferase PglX [Deltaproteobacteria bacterium]|jgi:hypothetical protein|nr:BREX-1 system adenine-specific DNA-methyltransferase PglX [Deltaproteobacteria bacterium]